MASSSSFKIGGEIIRDKACFDGLRHYHGEPRYILIEKSKQFYPVELITEYLSDLKEMGLKINKYNIDENTNEISIKISDSATPAETTMLSMAVRYLWDNRYGNCIYDDNFYYRIEAYFNIKEKLKNTKLNKLEMFCLAHNVANSVELFPRMFCTNHNWVCDGMICAIKKDFSGLNGSVNAFFTIPKGVSQFVEKHPILCRKPSKNWTRHGLLTILRYVKNIQQ